MGAHRAQLMLVSAAAVLLVACGTMGEPPGPLSTVARATFGEETWVLTEGVVAGRELRQFEDFEATVTVHGDLIRGISFGAPFELDEDGITIQEGDMTAMACEARGVMQAEEHFLDGLEAVETVDRNEDSLTMSGPDTELRFTTDEAAEPGPSAPPAPARTGDPVLAKEVLLTVQGSDPEEETVELGPFASDLVLHPDTLATWIDLQLGLWVDLSGLPAPGLQRGECMESFDCEAAVHLDLLPPGPTTSPPSTRPSSLCSSWSATYPGEATSTCSASVASMSSSSTVSRWRWTGCPTPSPLNSTTIRALVVRWSATPRGRCWRCTGTNSPRGSPRPRMWGALQTTRRPNGWAGRSGRTVRRSGGLTS